MKSILSVLFSLFTILSYSQANITPSIDPEFFSADQEITITYNTTGTALQSLSDAWIWMWVPGQGDAPSNINPANSNTSATNPAKFSRSTSQTGEVFFSITLTPTEFLNIPKEDIDKIGIIIKGNDWSNGQSDDYLVAPTDGFTIVMDNPTGNFGFFSSSTTLPIEVRSSEAADLEILIDNIAIASETNATQISANHTIIDDGAVHSIVARGNNGIETIEARYTYTLTPSVQELPMPVGMEDGINFSNDNTSATLVLRAPFKENVFVIGDWNNWSLDNNYLMHKDGDFWWLTIDNLNPTEEYQYQYLVDGATKIADPYTEKISSQFDDGEIISDGRYPNLKPYPANATTEAVSFLQAEKNAFNWSEFTRPANEDLMIYELLVRDFTEERTFDAVTARLDYLEGLGINAIELMPVQEFEGNLSWGYNPSSMFAVDKYYGTELDFKTLVDEAHKRGMAVILDIVLNHQFGRNSLVRLYNEGLYGNPTSQNPWFNTAPKHDFNVGYDMNHESTYTQYYVDRVVTYWLEEYNIDGYRFDLSKGFTQRFTRGDVGAWGRYDASRIALLKRMADVIWSSDPTAYVILEHFADNNEEKELAEYGMMLWGNVHGTYINLARGSSASINGAYHEGRGWNTPHLISYMESHDEERQLFETQKSNSKTVAIERSKLATAFFLTIPGPKMIWQFGEFGYDLELNNDRLGVKPTRWEYLEDPERKKLFDLYTSLMNLKTQTDYTDNEYFSWNPNGYVKSITIEHPDVDIYIVGNFDDDPQDATLGFTQTGTWYNYFSGEAIEVTEPNKEVTLRGGEWYMYTSTLIENYIEDQMIVLGQEMTELNELAIFPNPSSTVINLKNHTGLSNYTIHDMSGRVYQDGTIFNNQPIDISTLSPGLYFMKISSDTQKNVQKAGNQIVGLDIKKKS